LDASSKRIERDIVSLAKLGATSNGGVSRFALDKADLSGRSFVLQLMNEAGLLVRIDKAGNIIGLRPGTEPGLPVIATGSHTDTVIDGGWFDGAIGVLGAIEAIRIMNEQGIRTRRSVEVILFTGEEGSRYVGTLGSRVMSGALSLDDANSLVDPKGVTFRQAMLDSGYDERHLANVPRRKGEIDSFVEMHVEQGPVLEKAGCQIGVVEAIVGLVQMRAVIQGEAAHAGTTPMDSRRDALLGAAKSILKVNEAARSVGGNCVGTVGWVNVEPGAFNVVPGKVEFGIDVRDTSEIGLGSAIDAVKSSVADICRQSGLQCEVKERARTTPTPMSTRIITTIDEVAQNKEFRYMRMPSRAGHDTMQMARFTDVGMIFVPSRRGINHSPKEWTDWDDIARGTDVLLGTLEKLAERI